MKKMTIRLEYTIAKREREREINMISLPWQSPSASLTLLSYLFESLSSTIIIYSLYSRLNINKLNIYCINNIVVKIEKAANIKLKNSKLYFG